ncbi:MAG: tRNA-binding protein [Halobacteriales archaeon]
MSETPLESTIKVGRINQAERFEEARKPELFKLWIDLGDQDVQSAAQLGYHHEPEAIIGEQVLCATGLGIVNIAGFESEVLTVGVPGDDGYPVLVTPDEEVPLGGLLY